MFLLQTVRQSCRLQNNTLVLLDFKGLLLVETTFILQAPLLLSSYAALDAIISNILSPARAMSSNGLVNCYGDKCTSENVCR